MRIILSRKGFDSSSGGVPSPIFPDGTTLSLFIPDKLSRINTNHQGGLKYIDDSEPDSPPSELVEFVFGRKRFIDYKGLLHDFQNGFANDTYRRMAEGNGEVPKRTTRRRAVHPVGRSVLPQPTADANHMGGSRPHATRHQTLVPNKRRQRTQREIPSRDLHVPQIIHSLRLPQIDRASDQW